MAEVEEKMKFVHFVYFYIILKRFMDPTKLFSKYYMGISKASLTHFLAAKCMIPSIGSPISSYFLKIESRKVRSRMSPL